MSVVKWASIFSSSCSNLLKQCSQQKILPSVISRGLKHRGTLEIRCKDCYFEKVDNRWWVKCKSKGRHTQQEIEMDVKKRWIVTHRTYGHRPFQKKAEAYICNLAPPGPYDYKINTFLVKRNVPNKYATFLTKSRLGLNHKLFVNLDGVKDPVSIY